MTDLRHRAAGNISTGVCIRIGFIAGWNVFISQNRIRVVKEGDRSKGPGSSYQKHDVSNLGTEICELMGRPTAALGWCRMEDDAEILFLYDKADRFGYAFSINDPQSSEWGYAPFPAEGESEGDGTDN